MGSVKGLKVEECTTCFLAVAPGVVPARAGLGVARSLSISSTYSLSQQKMSSAKIQEVDATYRSIRNSKGQAYAAPLTTTTTLNANHTAEFVQNSLISREYETVPLNKGHIPGCTVHVPSGVDVIGQRKAAATLHNQELRPLVMATKGQWTDMQLLDLRPEQRAYFKEYIYAENLQSKFMRFPTKQTFDHRT